MPCHAGPDAAQIPLGGVRGWPRAHAATRTAALAAVSLALAAAAAGGASAWDGGQDAPGALHLPMAHAQSGSAAPAVVNVNSSMPDGVYGAGSAINVTVAFNGQVVWRPSDAAQPPRLALNMSGEERLAAYASGNGTSQLVFTYTVRAGDSEDDLDYRGAGALTGGIESASGTAAVLALQPPGSPGSLGHSSDILVDHAAPVLMANGSVGSRANAYLHGIDAFYVEDRAYALTAGYFGHLNLYRLYENGTVAETDHVVDGTDRTSAGLGNFSTLNRAWDVAAFDLGGSAHAIVTSRDDHALSLIRVHGNGTLEARGSTPSRAPHGVDVFDLDGRPHVIVTMYEDRGIRLLRIHDNGTMEARSSITSPDIPFRNVIDADAFAMNGTMHAVVVSSWPTSYHRNFIQLVRIPDSGILEYENGWRLTSYSERGLVQPFDVKAFYLDGRPHALVTSPFNNGGVQLVRVHWNGTLQGMDRLLDGNGGLELGGAKTASVFNGSGGGTYAVVAAESDSALNLIRLRGDGTLLPAGSVDKDDPGFAELKQAFGVDVLDLGGSVRAVSSAIDPWGGVQLARMSAASATNVTAAAGTYGTGEAIYISVLFDRAVEAAGPLEIVLDSGARAAYYSGNGTSTLVFRYVVGSDDRNAAALGYAGASALRAGPGGSITVAGAPGTHASAALPPPGSPRSLSGSAEVSVVAAPSVESVSSPTAAGPHGTGRTILVNVTFDEAVTVDTASGSPLLELATGGGGGSGANATYAPELSGGPTLMFSYAVRQGDAAADLDYTGRAALFESGALIRDRDGNAANLTLPDPEADGLLDAGALELETVMPRVESVASPQEGAYGAGRTILVNVTFSEPVIVTGAPRLGLDLEAGGAAGRHASYGAGSGAASLRFEYTVRSGDFAPNLGYAGQDALALNGGSIRDAAGNAANLTLPGPEGGGLLGAGRTLEVDGRPPPAVLSVSSPNASETYRAGETIHVHVNFSKRVFVAGGPVLLGLETGRVDQNATYAAGNGTDRLVFAYTVRQGDSSPGLAYAGQDALALNGGTVRDSVGGAANLELPGPEGGGPLPGAGGAIAVDTTPYVESVSSDAPGGVYGLGDLLRIEVEFDVAVSVAGAPALALETGPDTGRSAAFERMGDANTTLVFNYTVGPGDRTDDLGYAGTGALSGTITDVLGNPASLALPDPADPAGSLSMDGAPLAVDHAAPVLIPAGSAANGTGGFDRLHEAQAVSALKIDGAQYLLAGFNGLQLIRVHENGTMEAAGSAANGTGGFDALGGTHGIEAFEMGGGAYAIAASASDFPYEYNSVQLVRVHGGNGTLEAKGSLKKADDASLMLGGAFDVEVFEMGPANHTYALVSAADDDGLQLIRVHENGTLEAAGSARDAARSGGAVAGLDRPYRIDAFRTGDGSVRALVTAYGNDSVHLFDVEPGSLEMAARAGDGSAGFRLDNPTAVAGFELAGGERRALVATHTDFLQLVRVRGGGAIEAVSNVEDGARGFSELDDGHAIAVLGGGGGGGGNTTYALVTADGDADNAPGGVQLARVLGDGTLLAAGSASSRDAGLGLLNRPAGADTFDMGGRKYAAVASEADHSVTLIRLARTSVTSVGAATAGTAYAAGSPVGVAVNFDGNVSFSAGGPEPVLRLDVGGSARTAAYAGGNGSSSLRFSYTVEPGDNAGLAYAGVAALEGTLRDVDGYLADATLPDPGSPSSLSGPARIALDTVGPRVVSVASPNATESGPAAAPLGIGDTIHVAVTFSEPVFVDTASGTPTIALEVGGAGRNATYASGSGSAVLVFTYPVMPGDSMSLGLDHSGRPISPNGGTIEDEAGNRADLALPAPTGSLVAGLDGAPPRVVGVSSPTAAGAYMAGQAIMVNVTFSEDVEVEGGPLLGLAAGAAGRNATYASGSGSPSLLFRYIVQDGDAAADLGYAGAGALYLGGGSIRDAAGNDARLELPAPGSPGSLSGSAAIVLDTAAPRVAGVASPAPPDRVHRAGERIEVSVNFDEGVSPSPGAPPPALLLNVGGSPVEAAHDPAASAASSLAFAYTVRTGDLEDDLAYYNASALSGAIADAAGNPANLTLPEPGSPGSLSGSSEIRVDGTLPAPASASAVFTGPGTVRIDYGAPLGPPDGHEGAVYGGVTMDGEDGERPVSSVSGLGTRTHAVSFGGAGVGDAQAGSIRLLVGLEGEEGGTRHEFPAGSIRIAAGATARTLSPPPGDPSPVAPIEDDGFVRAVNATAAGDAARPAINVSGLPAPDGAPARGPGAVVMPGGIVSIVASFAEVSFPPSATASPVPADGLFKLYLSPRPPTAQDVAGGFMVPAGGVEVLVVVEVGDNATRIEFDMPVRILLRGMADGSAFYVNGTGDGGAVVPIPAECDAGDAFGEVHERLGGAGECWLDSGPDKVIYTYHLTRFGAAEAPPGVCAARVETSPIDFERIDEGGRSSAKEQRVESTGSLPFDEVTIRATDWARADNGSTAMPANATQVRTAGDGAWRPLEGEVGAELGEGGLSASVQLRLDIPAGALPAGATAAVRVVQTVTYTVSCVDAPG